MVAVNTDELIQEYKKKQPVISFEERVEIVKAIKYVDEVVPQKDRDKISAFKKYNFDVMFVGDDWKGSKVFEETDIYMRKHGGCVVYIPYTPNTSSTYLKKVLNKIYLEK